MTYMDQEKPVPKFFDQPPVWFAVIVWFYPYVYSLVCFIICALAGDHGVNTRVGGWMLLVGFPLPLCILFVLSSWFRVMVLVIVPLWLLGSATFLGITHGALTSAISKAYSAVTDPRPWP
jgi:hypothetical protein